MGLETAANQCVLLTWLVGLLNKLIGWTWLFHFVLGNCHLDWLLLQGTWIDKVVVMHIPALAKLEWQSAGTIRVSYLPAELYSEDAALRFHVTTVKQFDISFTTDGLTLVRIHLESILNGGIPNLLGHI